MSAPRIAVLGVGRMGRFHAEKVRERSRDGSLELACIHDRDAERAAEVAAAIDAPVAGSLDDALERADAVVVAVPTSAHQAVVARALEAGCDVLVEKPIAADPDQAEKLLVQARERGRVLQVGHLEWFNAAMQEVLARVDKPLFFESHRMGPFPERSTDVDVVRDLMIHDLDIIQRLVGGEEPERVDAVGVPVLTDRVDIANARLSFPCGAVANCTASRVSPTPMRKIRLFQLDGYFSIDFLEQSVTIATRARDAHGQQQDIRIAQLEIDRGDALLKQLDAFVTAIRERHVDAGAAEQGLSALRTALRVIDAMPETPTR